MASILGKWNVSYNSKLGEHLAVWEFTQNEDGTIKGVQESEGMTQEFIGINVDEDNFDFRNEMMFPEPMGKKIFHITGGIGTDRLGGISKNEDSESIVAGVRIPAEVYRDTVNLDGKFDLDITLTYDSSEWIVEYYFEPMKQDVKVTGIILDGNLEIRTDSCGYCEPMLPLFQGLYEKATGAK